MSAALARPQPTAAPTWRPAGRTSRSGRAISPKRWRTTARPTASWVPLIRAQAMVDAAVSGSARRAGPRARKSATAELARPTPTASTSAMSR
ncbi:hypothetical protein V2I01_01135 [Micromonospora sp. BRA006-A]|nr:hypothetical protein [Micromonospora sp. BRA006-A]